MRKKGVGRTKLGFMQLAMSNCKRTTTNSYCIERNGRPNDQICSL